MTHTEAGPLVALATGCSSGIGQALAIDLAAAGYVTYATMRNTAKRGPLDDAAAARGVEVRVLPLDVADRGSVDAAFATVAAQAGRLDLLVNNAGQSIHGPTEEFSDEEALALFQANFFGAHRTMRAALPIMREQGSGVIVNVTSIIGLVTPPYFNMYAATKHALDALTESVYYEVKPFGVRVHLIEPGAVATAITANTPHVAAAGSDSPYWPVFNPISKAVLDGIDARGIPSEEASAIILDVCQNADRPFRTIIGDDAKRSYAVRRQLDDAAFMELQENNFAFARA